MLCTQSVKYFTAFSIPLSCSKIYATSGSMEGLACLHARAMVFTFLFHTVSKLVFLKDYFSPIPPSSMGSASLVAIPYKNGGLIPSSIWPSRRLKAL